ncbi:hypothetical protein ACTXT7_002909 [Hymenolepis weldensis]
MENICVEDLEQIRKLFKSKPEGSRVNSTIDFSKFDEKIDNLDRETLMKLFNASRFLFPEMKS